MDKPASEKARAQSSAILPFSTWIRQGNQGAVDSRKRPARHHLGGAKIIRDGCELFAGRKICGIVKVCQMAGDKGLSIALEPLNRFESDLINTAEDVMRLIDDINHPAAKVLLDGFHMAIEEPDLEKAITSVGDRLIHVQVSENYRGTPGTGQTPWFALKSGLEKINYSGVVSIESFTPEIKELAGAVCIWKNLAKSQDGFASEGFTFLKKLLTD